LQITDVVEAARIARAEREMRIKDEDLMDVVTSVLISGL